MLLAGMAIKVGPRLTGAGLVGTRLVRAIPVVIALAEAEMAIENLVKQVVGLCSYY